MLGSIWKKENVLFTFCCKNSPKAAGGALPENTSNCYTGTAHSF